MRYRIGEAQVLCVTCGQLFRPVRSTHKYCSEACRRPHTLAQKRRWWKDNHGKEVPLDINELRRLAELLQREIEKLGRRKAVSQ